MQRSPAVLITMACAAGVCLSLGPGATRVLVPGADQVRLTKRPDDVANCKPVGNIHLKENDSDGNEFRNQVAGLGGNAATLGSPGSPSQGVAYRCP
jgi:hypothetical protein